eukprot:TRINITY_DN4081_c0_g3_i1.p1 TRINITY_DN4081_c0_g3~~TRINITY_DN4081_c0_g3_i1.p1  ORF type:complete len:305 (+),score=68.93 TRINITY_DN4081_c0_g3_i1:28-915(+)
MIRRPPRSTQSRSSAASDVYKRQVHGMSYNEISLWNTERIIGVGLSALLTIIVHRTEFIGVTAGYCLVLAVIDLLIFVLAFFPIFYPPIPVQPRDTLRTMGAIGLVLFVLLAILQFVIFYSQIGTVPLYLAIKHSCIVFLEILLAVLSYWLTVFERKWTLASSQTTIRKDAKGNVVVERTVGEGAVSENAREKERLKGAYEDVARPKAVADPHDPLEAPTFICAPPNSEKGVEDVKEMRYSAEPDDANVMQEKSKEEELKAEDELHKEDIIKLSLIHICRCRRLLTCRSRWSPYH